MFGFSGTILAIQRVTPEMVKLTIRDTKGGLYDMQIPHSIEAHIAPLAFGLDNLVNVHIEGVTAKTQSFPVAQEREVTEYPE